MAVGAGYEVLGGDVSEALLRLARAAAPSSRFERASLYETVIPPHVAAQASKQATR
jgi:hypothetical protein